MNRIADIFAPGMMHYRAWTVSEAMLYAPGGDPSRNTLSSPEMINQMEITAAEMIDSQMPNRGYTVGFHVDVKHLAPAALGADIVTSAELIEISAVKFKFKVEARTVDDGRLIGIGTHRRAAIFP